MNVPAALAKRASEREPAKDEDALRKLRARLAYARDLGLEIETLEEQIESTKDELAALLRDELPTMFQQLGIRTLGLDASGNMPAYDTKLAPYYHAVIPADPAKAEAALDHVEKVWKMPDLVKTTVTAKFGMRERKDAVTLQKFLKKSGFDFDSKRTIPWASLTAEVRRRFEDGQPLGTAELEKIGAVVGRVVKMEARKE